MPCCSRLCCRATAATAAERRALTADDINALHEVDDPQVSPDGEWVAYTVRTADLVKDKRITHVWMASWDGTAQRCSSRSPSSSEHTPRWSPDGKYLSFLTARGDDEEPEQLWLLDRAGGEASPLTGFNGDVVDYAWSPDGKRLALIVADEDPRRKKKGEEDKTPPPIVIDRYYFKEDETGYLGTQRQHLYVFDVASRKAEILTPGKLRRGLAVVVARRQADRVLQQARRRSGSQQRVRSVRDRSAARRDAAAAHEIPGRQRRRVVR